jgi:glycosyltransferase involved in cell wall biosynthesis
MSVTKSQPLVSIIIPCYNCERWVRQTVESCFNQSHPNIEIIVVDDGSTDNCLEILREFSSAIRLETGPNRGGNSARNRGFALSAGEYIQFLDADDYLESDKIARQVRFLQETQADVVYGDWRYRRHLPGTKFSYLDKIEISGIQKDILLSLLSGRWWVAPGALLYRRQAVDRVGGWDEGLRAAQDRDFLTTVALSGATISYQPGCHFIYRKYGAVTVSSSNLARWVDSHCASLKKSEIALARAGNLTEQYRAALTTGYFELARGTSYYTIRSLPTYANYQRMLDQIIQEIQGLSPNFRAANETRIFRTLESAFGFEFAMRLLWARLLLRYARVKFRSVLPPDLMLRARGVELEQEQPDSPQADSTETVVREGLPAD